MLEAQSKWNKQVDQCYRPTEEDAKTVGESLPMLASDASKNPKKIKYPCYVSKKLDGVRCIAEVKKGKVTLWSRGGKTYPCPEHIMYGILSLHKNTGYTKFDGELYIHGMPLQSIVSCVKKENENTKNLEFWIFDLPMPEAPFRERYRCLARMIDHNIAKCIKFVDNRLVGNEKLVKESIGQFMEDGFEGAIIRNMNGLYEFNFRSNDLLKWKLFLDDEAEIGDVERDKLDEAIFHCRWKGGNEFKCKIKGDHDFRSYENLKDSVGKHITFKYQGLTEDKVPQFPVGLAFREVKNGKVME